VFRESAGAQEKRAVVAADPDVAVRRHGERVDGTEDGTRRVTRGEPGEREPVVFPDVGRVSRNAGRLRGLENAAVIRAAHRGKTGNRQRSDLRPDTGESG